ncbi:acyl-CoA dehydrogenase [Streptomyces sp. NPDC048484]|uniref:acyl-CoA dehydrogenase family protein n=1 Tax=Streptomyces sp. NPDC048484 TaxID=3155146 RepID=UPI00343B4D0C
MSATRPSEGRTLPTESATPLQQLFHGDSFDGLAALDTLLDTPAFTQSAPPTGPARHARTYRRLQALGLLGGGAIAVYQDPVRMLASLEWSAVVDPPVFLAATVQYTVCVPAMRELGHPGPYLSELIDEIDRHEAFGSIMITEVGRGNSHLATRTEARFDPADRTFSLTTPDPGAAKFMSHVAGSERAHTAIVYAKLVHGGRHCGVFPFAVRIRDGATVTAGVRIAELPETTAVPLNYALVSFEGTRVPYDGWLRDTAEITADGEFTDPLGDPDLRLMRSLAGSSNASTGAAAALTAAARAAVTIGLRYSGQRLTMGRLGPGLPVLRFRTQQEALYTVLAEVCAASLLAAGVKSRYVEERRGSRSQVQSGRPVWAPWAAVSREQALAKAAATRVLERAAGVCRERSGAQGLLSVNRLLEYEGLAQVYQAAAGDNLLIRLDTGKQLVEDADYTPPSGGGITAHPISAEDVRALAATQEHTLLSGLRERLNSASVEEMSPLDIWNPLLSRVLDLADAHQRRLLLDAFETGAAHPGPQATALRAFQRLYGLDLLEQTLAWHLENGTLSRSDAARVHAEREQALDAVIPHVEVLLDGFALPPARLQSPMADADFITALAGRTR